MEEELQKKLDQQEELLQKVFQSSEKTRKYLLWTLIFSLVVFVIPLIILAFVLPSFIDTLTSGMGTF